MAYADYTFYHNVYKGNLSEAAFGRLSERASDYIDSVTNKKYVDETVGDDVKKACCAVAEAWDLNEQTSVKASESVDGYSVSYKSDSNSGSSRRLIDAMKLYLPDVGAVRWI